MPERRNIFLHGLSITLRRLPALPLDLRLQPRPRLPLLHQSQPPALHPPRSLPRRPAPLQRLRPRRRSAKPSFTSTKAPGRLTQAPASATPPSSSSSSSTSSSSPEPSSATRPTPPPGSALCFTRDCSTSGASSASLSSHRPRLRLSSSARSRHLKGNGPTTSTSTVVGRPPSSSDPRWQHRSLPRRLHPPSLLRSRRGLHRPARPSTFAPQRQTRPPRPPCPHARLANPPRKLLQAWPIFLFLTLLGFAAVILTARDLDAHARASPASGPPSCWLRLGLFLMLFTRFWQRGVETSLALQNPIPRHPATADPSDRRLPSIPLIPFIRTAASN